MGVTHKSTISQHKLTNLVMRAHTHTHIYDTSTQKNIQIRNTGNYGESTMSSKQCKSM